MEEEKKTGHTIRTYRVRLYDRHFDRLKETKELYGKAVGHFFEVLQKEPQLLKTSGFLALRGLEAKCIGTKEMKALGEPPAYPLEGFPKLPLYFRRSAINRAIDLVRKNAGTVEPNMVLYKGMYRNFTEKSIEIKLYDGEKWIWTLYPFAGRKLPTEAAWLSPMLVLEKKTAWLEVPVSFVVEDVRTVRERMEVEEDICALAFPDSDTLAVAVLMSRDGQAQECRFFHGGKAKAEQQARILARLQASEKSRGRKVKAAAGTGQNVRVSKENSLLYKELRGLNHYYAHKTSRNILDYCMEKNIKVIVVPNFEASEETQSQTYFYRNTYQWLGRAIIRKLKYKAFQEGIVVTSVKPYRAMNFCSECGAKIHRYDEGGRSQRKTGGKLFLCPNGHKGNTAENMAKNVGKTFLSYFPRGE